jgi:integrase
MPVERTRYGTWRARWTDPWGRQVSKTHKTKTQADAYYRRMLGDMARGDYIDPRLGRITLERWADEWLQGARNLSRGGHDTYRRDLDRHILPVLGKVPVGRLSGADIDRYLSTVGLGLAPSTVHRHYRTLHRMLAVAVRRGIIPRNPAEHIEPPRVPKTERTALTIAQVDDLADVITPRYRAWVYTMAYGGLRWSESVGLRRARVDVPTVRVTEQLIHRGRGEWERNQPKTGKGRVVTLPGFAADELATHLDRYSLPGPDGLVFPTSRGTPIQSPSFTANVFKRALRKAGLPDIRIHDLRHTAVSLAIDAGANIKVSQARAGHASASLHLDTYGHRYEAADVAVAERLDVLRAESQRRRLRAV